MSTAFNNNTPIQYRDTQQYSILHVYWKTQFLSRPLSTEQTARDGSLVNNVYGVRYSESVRSQQRNALVLDVFMARTGFLPLNTAFNSFCIPSVCYCLLRCKCSQSDARSFFYIMQTSNTIIFCEIYSFFFNRLKNVQHHNVRNCRRVAVSIIYFYIVYLQASLLCKLQKVMNLLFIVWESSFKTNLVKFIILRFNCSFAKSLFHSIVFLHGRISSSSLCTMSGPSGVVDHFGKPLRVVHRRSFSTSHSLLFLNFSLE